LNPDGTAKKRGGMGVKVTSHPPLAAALMVGDRDDLIIATRRGKFIRLAAADVPIYHREARGVRVVRLQKGDRIVAVAIDRKVRE
jgi:DNA gyrase subunit A